MRTGIVRSNEYPIILNKLPSRKPRKCFFKVRPDGKIEGWLSPLFQRIAKELGNEELEWRWCG